MAHLRPPREFPSTGRFSWVLWVSQPPLEPSLFLEPPGESGPITFRGRRHGSTTKERRKKRGGGDAAEFKRGIYAGRDDGCNYGPGGRRIGSRCDAGEQRGTHGYGAG